MPISRVFASDSARSTPNSTGRCARADSILCKRKMLRCLHTWRSSTLSANRSDRSSQNWKEKLMTEIERILDQLRRTYEGDAWHGPAVREVLAGITAEQAHARPLQNAHSIWELVHHMAVWESVGRRRLEGDRAQIDISSPDDWPPADDTAENAWEQAKAALDRGHQALVAAIARVPESRLDAPVFEGMSTVYVTLHGVIQHDLYHAGQIAMLKKGLVS